MEVKQIAQMQMLKMYRKYGISNKIPYSTYYRKDIAEFSADGIALSKKITRTRKSSPRKEDEEQFKLMVKYIAEAKQNHTDLLENAGSSIDLKPSNSYVNSFQIYQKALTEKYNKLAEETRSYPDPMQHINDKYHNKYSLYYAWDLTDQERTIACSYELQMLNNGKINGADTGDSLGRGFTFHAYSEEAQQAVWRRRLVNRQLQNIWEKMIKHNSFTTI